MFKNNKNGEFVKPKLTTKQKLHTTISMLALTVIALTTATYAWFTLAASTRVNELDLEVSAGAKLKIATNNLGNNVDDYYDEVVGTDGDNVDNDIDKWLQDSANGFNIALADILLSPQTSTDGVDYYLQNGTKTVKPNLSSGSYMEYELWLIAENDMRVHLSTNNDDDEIWTHIDAKELGNDSAQENIVNCVRMAFFSTDAGGSERTLIWAPNSGHDDTRSVSLNADAVTGLYEQGEMDFNEDTWICELQANEAKLVTVRVWVEGEDPDCIDDVQKAKFRTWLHFQGTDSDNNPIS